MLFILHMLIWIKQRPAKVYLLSSLMALGATVNAMCELGLLHAQTISSFIYWMKVENLAIAVLIVSMVWFVDLYLRTARRWLTILVTILWVVALVVNFVSPTGVVYSEINELTTLTTFWGEPYTIATGMINTWKIVADVTVLLVAIHALDTSIQAQRQGIRERAWIVGGSIVFFILVGGAHTMLVDEGIIKSPYMVAFAFLAIVFALSYLLVVEVVKVPLFTRELQASRQELERMTRANSLGELSSSLAHELNQPLAAILSNAQAAQRFLSQEPVDLDEIREILADIVRDDKRAGEVIHSLRRMLAHGESQKEVISLNRIIDDVIPLMRAELDTRKVRMRFDKDSSLPPVEVSVVEIQQVVVNLISNALRATKDMKKPEMALKTKLDGEYVRFTLEDNGAGIDRDHIGQVFDPFHTTRVGGLGMGLAICRRIIEEHGGRIEAENRLGGGARFTFALPPAAGLEVD
jgi:signal transduction histidine kinase